MSHRKSDKERLVSLKSLSLSEIIKGRDGDSVPYLKHVFDLYAKYFGELCVHCSSKYAHYINRLKSLNPNTMSEKIKRKFRLKAGKVIHIKGTGEMYSDKNITDEIAAKLLTENPNRKQLFKVIPDDFDFTVPDSDEPQDWNEYKVSELKEMFPDVSKGKNKAEFIANIEAFILEAAQRDEKEETGDETEIEEEE